MLEKAFEFERLTDFDTLLMDSDQGGHYQMKQYRHTLGQYVISKVCLVKATVTTMR
ncbi:hypothetical protein J2T13_005340 [Paenibacillus sp. DS2015]